MSYFFSLELFLLFLNDCFLLIKKISIMMNRFKLVILLILALSYTAESKTKITLIDKENDKPVPYAKFIAVKTLADKDTSVTQMTNKSGSATINLDLPYRIEIEHTGYEKLSKLLNETEDLNVYLERKVFYIDEIVTTGQYSPQSSQKSVYKVNTISEEKIIAQSAFNLRDLLMTETNIQIQQDGILGTSMSINGLKGENIKILIDGIPVIGRIDKSIDLSQINLNNARRVEIIEGPMSVMYGTDALGGVVNIITKDEVENSHYVNMNSYYESVGTYNFDGLLGVKFGNSNIMISGGRNFFGGYSTIDNSRKKEWNPKEQYFSDWQYNLMGESMTFRYNGQYYDDFILNRGNPFDAYRETAYDDHYKTRRFTNTLSLKGEIAKNRFFDLSGNYSTYTRNRNTYFKNLVTLKENLVDDRTDVKKFDNFMLRANYSHDNVLKSFSYMAGIDFQAGTVTGDRIKDKFQESGDYALYTSAQLTLGNAGFTNYFKSVVIQPALRFIYNTKYDAPVVPSLNIKVDINSETSVRASYAKGFRAPSLEELYFEFKDINHNLIGNPDLKAEISDSYILGLNYHQSAENYSFKIEPGLFYNHIKNQISSILTNIKEQEYKNMNIGEFNSMGGNISLSYVRADLSSKIGISYTGRQRKSSQTALSSDIAFSPEAMINIMYNLPVWELKFNTFYKYTGKYTDFIAESETLYTPFEVEEYHNLDISFMRNFVDDMITVSFGFKNLFDVKDVRSSSISSGAHTGDLESKTVAWGRRFNLIFRLNIK